MRNRQQDWRRRCDDRVHTLAIPHPWDLVTFLSLFSERRGRPILLDAAPELAGTKVSAKWVAHEDADLIFYAPTDSVFYLELNVFHEVGHMLCGHDEDENGALLSLGDMESMALAPSAATKIFSRGSRFETRQEQEAEHIACQLKAMVDRQFGRALVPGDPSTAALRSVMRRTLGSS